MSDNRPTRYVETTDDGEELVVYRASGLSMCDRIFAALDQAYEPMAHPQWFQEVLDEGTAMEDVIRGTWVDEYGEGEGVTDDQLAVEIKVMDGVVIRGHIDGIAKGSLWEAKKFRPSTWSKFIRSGVEVMPYYPMQLAVYQHATKAMGVTDGSAFFVGGLYDSDKEEILEIQSFAYPDPVLPLLAIKKRIAKLEGLINSGKHVMDVSCSTAQYPCPFYYLHDDDSPEPKERPADDVIAPLLTLITELEATKKPLDAESAALAKQIKAAKEGVEGWFEGSGLESGDTSMVKVGDDEYTLKVQEVARKGYSVAAGGYTKVTVKKNDDKNKNTTNKKDK